MRKISICLWLLLAAALAGCGPAPAATAEPQEFPTFELAPTEEVHENPMELGSTPESSDMPDNPPPVEKYVALSKADLATRLLIDADGISVIETKAIVWPDAALGCPAPGAVYAQGRVPGYQIRLAAQGQEYVYHTDLDGQVILCLEQGPAGSGPPPIIGVPID